MTAKTKTPGPTPTRQERETMTQTQTLKHDTPAVGLHGTTGLPLDEGELAAGTLVRGVEWYEDVLAGDTVDVCEFEASTDGGTTWHRQRTYGNLELAD